MSLFQPNTISFGQAPPNITDDSFPGIDPNDITIGIELEMAIFRLPADMDRGGLCPRPGNSKQMLKDALKDVESKLTAPNNVFYIKSDESINVSPGLDHADGAAAEVVTPILTNGDWEWVIPEMCAAINKAVTEHGAYFDFSPKRVCAVHVHVGVKGRHYTLGELRQIAKAVVIFEAAMDHHHPAHRRPVPGVETYIQSNRMSPGLGDLSVAQMVDKISGIVGSRQLICTVNGLTQRSASNDRYYKYNFCSTTKFGTIEFRQAGGSMDGMWISGWVRNVVVFLVSAVDVCDGHFRKLAGMADVGYAWPEAICELFGLPMGAPLFPLGTPVAAAVALGGATGMLDIGGLNICRVIGDDEGGGGEGDDGDDDVNDPGTPQRRRERDAFKKVNARVRRALRAFEAQRAPRRAA